MATRHQSRKSILKEEATTESHGVHGVSIRVFGYGFHDVPGAKDPPKAGSKYARHSFTLPPCNSVSSVVKNSPGFAEN